MKTLEVADETYDKLQKVREKMRERVAARREEEEESEDLEVSEEEQIESMDDALEVLMLVYEEFYLALMGE